MSNALFESLKQKPYISKRQCLGLLMNIGGVRANRGQFNGLMRYALDNGILKSERKGSGRSPDELIETESFLAWLGEKLPGYRHVLEHGDAWVIHHVGPSIEFGHYAYSKEELDCLKKQSGDRFLVDWLEPGFLQLGVAHEKALAKIKLLEAENAELMAEVTILRPIAEAKRAAENKKKKTWADKR